MLNEPIAMHGQEQIGTVNKIHFRVHAKIKFSATFFQLCSEWQLIRCYNCQVTIILLLLGSCLCLQSCLPPNFAVITFHSLFLSRTHIVELLSSSCASTHVCIHQIVYLKVHTFTQRSKYSLWKLLFVYMWNLHAQEYPFYVHAHAHLRLNTLYLSHAHIFTLSYARSRSFGY